ncbi:MAG: hypothetical protein CM1200mP2_59250 [Planctomycetaceae bacterium]|nr:MAG: hypothetical protein CM1200mP2_59250 [Planctomycetaceae bacterium]
MQLYSGGFNNDDCWDGHSNIDKNHRQFAGETDRPISGLLTDLKQRGLLESTLVVCCGELDGCRWCRPAGPAGTTTPWHSHLDGRGRGSGRDALRGDRRDRYEGCRESRQRADLHATILDQFGGGSRAVDVPHNSVTSG